MLEERAGEVFLQSMELEPSRRPGFVESACGGDALLRKRVEQLLEHEARMPEQFLAGQASLEGSYLKSGSSFAGFRILRRIGEGGMGTVYAALQSMPRREVALKLIRPGRMSQQALRRFRHEVEILGNLQHPGIAQIYEAGSASCDDGSSGLIEQPYLAMELVHGLPILTYAREHGLSIEARLELMARLSDAIHHAHLRAVIHRDLKPDNVLVSLEESTADAQHDAASGAGRPKILDFGVARVLDADEESLGSETRAGELLGTLAHMSPEQLSGKRDDVDARSDVYGLGVMLFQLLAGRLPIEVNDTDVQASLRRLVQGRAPLLESIDPRLRGDISSIVAKALEVDKQRRYQSAFDLAADLRAYLCGEAIGARADSALYLVRRQLQRHRRLFIAVACMLIVLGALAFLFARQAEDNRRLAHREASARQLSEDDYQRALAAIEFLTDVGQERLADIPQAQKAQRELLASALEFYLGLLERHADQSLEHRASETRLRVAEIQMQLGNPNAAHEQSNVLIDSMQHDALALAPELQAGAYCMQGISAHQLGDIPEAVLALERAVEIATTHLKDGQRWAHANYATAKKFLALIDYDSGRFAQAEGHLLAALALLDRAPEERKHSIEQRRERSNNLLQLGLTRIGSGRLFEAKVAFTEALELVRELRAAGLASPPMRKLEASLFCNLGSVADESGDPESARAHYQAAIEAGELLVWEHPDIPGFASALFNAHNNLAHMLAKQGDFDAARAHMQRAGELLDAQEQQAMPSRSILRQRLGLHASSADILIMEQRYAQALPLLRAALQLAGESEAQEPMDAEQAQLARRARINLGLVSIEMHDREASLQALCALDVVHVESEMLLVLEVLNRCMQAGFDDGSIHALARDEFLLRCAVIGGELVSRSKDAEFSPESAFWDSPELSRLIEHPEFQARANLR